MTDKLFDNFIKDKLQNHSAPVPDGLWEKIVQDEDERRPVVFWWWNHYKAIIGIVGVIGILVGSYITIKISNDHSNQIKKNVVVVNTSTKQGSIQKQNIFSSKGHQSNTSTNATQELSSNSSIQQNRNVVTKNKNEENLQISIPNPSNKKENGVLNPKLTTGDLVLDGKQINKISEYKYNHVHIGKKQSLGLIDINHAGEKMIGSKNDNSTFDEDVIIRKRVDAELMLSTMGLKEPSVHLNKIPLSGIDKCPSSTQDYSRNDWFVEAYVSPDYSFKSVKDNGAKLSYLDAKDSLEHTRVGFTIGARVTKNIGEHLLVKAGLQYAQINEFFNYKIENESRTIIEIDSRRVVQSPGDTVTIIDTTSYTQIGYRVRTSRNHYEKIEVPFSVGYEFGKRNDLWKLAINFGAIVNVVTWYKGETIDTSYNVVSIDSKGNGTNMVYSNDISFSLFGSVDVLYKLNGKIDFFAEPYFRYSLSDINSEEGFKQRFNTMGILLGVRMKINNKKQHF